MKLTEQEALETDRSESYVCRTCIENFYRNNRSR